MIGNGRLSAISVRGLGPIYLEILRAGTTRATPVMFVFEILREYFAMAAGAVARRLGINEGQTAG